MNTHPSSLVRTLTVRCRIFGPVEFVNVIPANVGQIPASNCADNDSSRNGTGSNRSAAPRSGIASQPWVVFGEPLEPEP